VGNGTAGLPVGVTIDGNRDDDDRLFALATELDTLLGVRSPLLQ
jgi:Asp-tRNA(Asn)/Glu-tRNA(Gln) amidotransferase A subunit family amidase